MNLSPTGLTTTSTYWHHTPIVRLVADGRRVRLPKSRKRIVYDSKVSLVLSEPLIVKGNDVNGALVKALPRKTVQNPERLNNGRLVPKFALARKFSPTFLKKKTTGKRINNGNHKKVLS